MFFRKNKPKKAPIEQYLTGRFTALPPYWTGLPSKGETTVPSTPGEPLPASIRALGKPIRVGYKT